MKTAKLLMVGDSLMEYGPWEKWFGDGVVNRGIGGLTTEGVYLHLNRVLKNPYDQIGLMAGNNDLLAGVPSAEILENYEKILKKIKGQQPEDQIYVHRPLPCNTTKLYLPLDNAAVYRLGQGLKTLAETHQARWVDLWDVLTKDGELKAEYTIDGIHLTEAAYDLWGERLAALLAD
ncbi:MAG: GDSL-type esterase/lipase family protein [Eubacterium sp.]|nr:GDSL-type esterase/lipase family protein [Eubacterium sp.]